MAQRCETHDAHSHTHGPGCGHSTIEHEGHTDYLHDGHMHNMHGDHVDEHRVSVDARNPEKNTAENRCSAHEADHMHGTGCGHEAVPHGSHMDYVVDGRLHNQEAGGNCHDHGAVEVRMAA
jgi:hypothetical protein